MREGLLFANAVAKVKEENLFTEERLSRMVSSKSLDDAVKILVEAGYGGGLVVDNPLDFEEVLSAEHKILLDFIDGIKVDNIGLECFFLQSDYHNIKSLLKAEYQKEKPERMLLLGGLIPVDELYEKISRETPNINPYVDKALREIRKEFEDKKSPRLIDTLIDKAMYRDIGDRLKAKTMDKYVRQYFTAYIDCINISSYVRSSRINGNLSFFLSNFIEGGSITEKDFSEMYPQVDRLKEYLKNTPYHSFADKANDAEMTEFDTARDNFILNIFRENRHDMFSVAPVMGYYLAKMNEIKVIRIVLVCIKNGVEQKEIKKRLRFMYA